MRLWIAAVGAKPRAGFEEPARLYLERMAPYVAGVEAPVFKSEEALWTAVEKERARTAPRVVLLDERGKQMGSEEFAQWLGRERDTGRQLVIFVVGPAEGWGKQRIADSGQRTEKQRSDGQRSEGQRIAYSGQRGEQRSAIGDQRSEKRRSADSGQRGEQRLAYSVQRSGKAGRGVGGDAEAMTLSLGPMTMAHELARVVLSEQVYRALTILAGHPYHRV